MRFLPNAVPVVVSGIALYFALLWGFESSRILTSPIYGLDKSAFAQIVYGIGRVLHLSPTGLLLVAAFFGAANLAVASLFICHIMDRIAAWGGKPDHESLEAALVLVVIATLVAAAPALIEGAQGMLRQHTLHLILAAVVTTLSIIERIAEREEKTRVAEIEKVAEAAAPPPTLRSAGTGSRWEFLRKAADSAG
jgi:hypothetical protein